jgi:hypothetical protein
MKPSIWLGYVLGREHSIRELAGGRATLWTGIGMVLLTSIARNYDQTFILEKPFLWLFGSLLFSLVSGTWLYLVVYGWFIRRVVAHAGGEAPALWGRWRTFMGLFWMTAPVAWLYAIPVERFFDSVTAAKANLTLLAIVSLWRVILMTRVMQCLTGARTHAILLWVLFAAVMEVLVVFFFGGAFAKALMAGMGGMRNSPEETLLTSAMSAVFGVAFWGAPVVLILALVFGRSLGGNNLPVPSRSQSGPGWLGALAVTWMALAMLPQIQLSRNVQVEKLFSAQKHRDALDYLAVHQISDFAPARVLAPNAFEREIFTDLPACFSVVQTNDPVWVRAHLIRRLDQMLIHYTPFRERRAMASYAYDEQVEHIASGTGWHGPNAAELGQLLDGLESIPEGRSWLAATPAFIAGIREAVRAGRIDRRQNKKTEEQHRLDLQSLSNRVDLWLGTNRQAP